GLDRNPLDVSGVRIAACVINRSLIVKGDVGLIERPVSRRVSGSVNGYQRCSHCCRQMQWSRVTSQEQFRPPRQRNELHNAGWKINGSLCSRAVQNSCNQFNFFWRPGKQNLAGKPRLEMAEKQGVVFGRPALSLPAPSRIDEHEVPRLEASELA